MKNAYVLEHHYGDDGNVSAGMILTDVSEKRFSKLENLGLVREATDKEVEAGYQPTIAPDESDAAGATFNHAELVRQELTDQFNQTLEALTHQRADDAERALGSALADLAAMTAQRDAAEKRISDMEQKASDAAANKQAKEPENKAAPKPGNKAPE